MNILVLSWNPGDRHITAGGRRLCYEFLRRADEDCQVHLLDSSPSFLSSLRSDYIQITEYVIPSSVRRLQDRAFTLERALEWPIAALQILIKGVRLAREADAIYVPFSELLFLSLPAVVVGRLTGTCIVLKSLNVEHSHTRIQQMAKSFPNRDEGGSGGPWHLISLLSTRINAWIHRRADLVVTLSEDLRRKLLEHGIEGPRLVVIPPGFDAPPVMQKTGAPKRYDGVFIGRHVPEKGIFDLLQVWSRVALEQPSAKLVTVGRCDSEMKLQLERLASELGIADNVTFRGVVAEADKFELLSQSKVCVFPSYVEGWGLVPIEAISVGLPVVLYDLDVYEEHIGTFEGVFRVPVGSIRRMTEAVVELLSKDEASVEVDLERARAQQLSWEEVTRREVEILVEACKPHEGTPLQR